MLLWPARFAQLAAAISGVLLARRRPEHRPFAIFLGVVTAANAARAALAAGFHLLRPPDAPPFEGATRIAFHVEEALFLTWPAGIAATTIVIFATRRRLAIVPVVAWCGLVAVLCAGYPAMRGEQLRQAYLAAELSALCVAAAMITLWTWRREPPTAARVCILLVCLADGGMLLLGAMRWGFWSRWPLNQAALVVLYLVVTIHQVITWRSSASSSASDS